MFDTFWRRRYYQLTARALHFAVQKFSRATKDPMKLAYFDCFSGISGDMILGALIDAGCPADLLRAELRSLQVPGWELTTEKVWKNGMAATYVRVKTEDQQKHRSLGAILEILKNSRLAPPVQERASRIF